VVFVASGAALSTLVAEVGDMQRTRAGCAAVVCGERFAGPDIVSLLAAGAADFVQAPFFPDELVARLLRSVGMLGPSAKAGAGSVPGLRDFIGCSPTFIAQVVKLPAMAACDAGVLILGETGTGKEVCAQAIHYLSPRASKPWVAVNCGAIPVELMESELFGHVRGAYTTAHASRQGLVAEAEGGTLFLDDIDSLPLAAQSKLLRFLQEREYRMVGANAVRRADVRVIAASNRDLAGLAQRGDFRQDLYFRLNVLPLTLPPLRERHDDVPELARHFAKRLARARGGRHVTFAPAAMRKLVAHDWPGNVRELQHVIERAVVLATGPVLNAQDIDVPGAADADEESFRSAKARVVRQFERSYIEKLLTGANGNVTRAAREAKKNRRAFFALMRKHAIEPAHFRADGRGL
jgi:two-component system response regulator GlrR